jgi:hypothetical protein
MPRSAGTGEGASNDSTIHTDRPVVHISEHVVNCSGPGAVGAQQMSEHRPQLGYIIILRNTSVYYDIPLLRSMICTTGRNK